MQARYLRLSRPFNCNSFSTDSEIPIEPCSQLFAGPKKPPFHRSRIYSHDRRNLGEREVLEFKKNQRLPL